MELIILTAIHFSCGPKLSMGFFQFLKTLKKFRKNNRGHVCTKSTLVLLHQEEKCTELSYSLYCCAHCTSLLANLSFRKPLISQQYLQLVSGLFLLRFSTGDAAAVIA